MQVIVQFAFIKELRMLSVGGLEFDCHLEVGFSVDALVNLAKGAFTDLSDQFEILSYFLRQMGHRKLSI